jgi:hypothetical protein
MFKRKLILRSQSRDDIVLKSANYAEFKTISCRLCEQELQSLFQILSYNFFKQIIRIFAFFYF